MADEKTKQEELEAKREARRRRRIHSQVLAYLAVIVVIVLVAGGVVFGVNYLSKMAAEREDNYQQQQQSAVNDLLQTEETLETPVETSEEEPVVELTYEQKLDQIVNAAIEVMPLEDKVAGLFLVTPESITGVDTVTQAGDATREILAKYAVGGLIYSSHNMLNADGFRQMLDSTELYSKYPVFLAVEEESGKSVQAAGGMLGVETEDAKAIAESGDPSRAYQAGVTIGTYLKDLGVNLDLAPAADLTVVEGSIMENRSFGDNAETVSEFAGNMLKGLEEQGITSCVKHFPGLGSVTTDPSDGIVVTERKEEEFRANEFQVFQSLIDDGVSMIMVSNLSAPSLTGDNTPCALSEKVVTDILRREMNYRGLIITDALSEKAVSDYYTADVAAITALKAGCDMILMPEDFELAYQGVLDAVEQGTISEERINDALRRVYRIKFADRVE